jgi:type II secretory pathway pseudopilin PulG
MHTSSHKTSHGFTLVETLVAVLVLTMSVGALLSLAAGGFYSVKYARNQIVANNLLQESLEFVRNSRDTAFEQGASWDDWQKNVLTVDRDGAKGQGEGCFSAGGCYVDPYTTGPKIKECDNDCSINRMVYFVNSSFYGYKHEYPKNIDTDNVYETTFTRSIRAVPSTDGKQLTITATMRWYNGDTLKTISQSTVLANWKK